MRKGDKICSKRNWPYLEVGELGFDTDGLPTGQSPNSQNVSFIVFVKVFTSAGVLGEYFKSMKCTYIINFASCWKISPKEILPTQKSFPQR